MADIVDSATRSRMMARIRGGNTKPEMVLRRGLHRLGFRFRLHVRMLPGRPDLVLPRYRAAIFVHGCFWHRHPGCRYATTPATRPEFWAAKFAANVARDRRDREALLALGWRVATVWECSLKKPQEIDLAANQLARWLRGEALQLVIGETRAVDDPSGPGAGSSRLPLREVEHRASCPGGRDDQQA